MSVNFFIIVEYVFQKNWMLQEYKQFYQYLPKSDLNLKKKEEKGENYRCFITLKRQIR